VVEQNLTSSEVREASTVLADDPFRAIRALPGVSATANNELLAEFSVMGAPFSEVGLYLDDVLLQSPFHNAPTVQNRASLTIADERDSEGDEAAAGSLSGEIRGSDRGGPGYPRLIRCKRGNEVYAISSLAIDEGESQPVDGPCV